MSAQQAHIVDVIFIPLISAMKKYLLYPGHPLFYSGANSVTSAKQIKAVPVSVNTIFRRKGVVFKFLTNFSWHQLSTSSPF